MEVNVEKLLKQEAREKFDIHKEKNAFLKRLYSENIIPPVKIHSYPLNTNNFLKMRTSYGISSIVMSCAVLLGIVATVIPTENQSPISLTSPVLASIMISNDNNYDDDPEFDLTFDTTGEVSGVIAANEDAKVALGAALLDGDSEIDYITNLILDSSKNTHYIDINAKKDSPNTVSALFTGNKEDISKVKSHIGRHCAKYFKNNYIFANLKDISSSGDEEMIKDAKEEAEKFGITIERYVLLKKIYSALYTLDSTLVFNQTFVDSYSSKSIEVLTYKASMVIKCVEKLEVIKKVQPFEEQITVKINNLKNSKNTNYTYYESAFNDFKAAYDELVQENSDLDLSFIDWGTLMFEQFDITDIFKWLCDKTSPYFAVPEINNKDIMKASPKGAKIYNANYETLKAKYDNLKALVNSYRQEERAREADIMVLFKQYESSLIKVSEDNNKYYEECQDKREKDHNYEDKRDDQFYNDFNGTDDDYFSWQD